MMKLLQVLATASQKIRANLRTGAKQKKRKRAKARKGGGNV